MAISIPLLDFLIVNGALVGALFVNCAILF